MENTKRTLLLGSIIFFASLLLITCQNDRSLFADISTDPDDIRVGERTFAQDCSACHVLNLKSIGPNLAGITREVSPDWIRTFIKDPKAMIDAGDRRAVGLFKEFGSYMPSYAFHSDERIDKIIAYLHTFEKETGAFVDTTGILANPIVARIEESEVVLALQPFAEIPPSSDKKPRTRIVKMIHIPNSNRLFVSDLRGQLYELIDQHPIKVLDMNLIFPNFVHQSGLGSGFGSFAFHPDFLQNGLLYFSHTEAAGSAPADFTFADSIKVALQWVLSEWKVDNPTSQDFKGVERELFRINMTSAAHGMQDVNFNPYARPGQSDFGKLFINIGDGGAALQKYVALVDNKLAAWGKIYRIDPQGNNSKNGQYGIPEDNPFVDVADALPETYAHGFRNPHRTVWDKDGRMLVSGIGHNRVEEVNWVQSGRDYGWPYREGTFMVDPIVDISNVYPLPDSETKEYTYPVAQYDHDEGNAISGGYEYIGNDIPQLKGKYLFGDIVRGRLFYINTQDIRLGSQAKVYSWNITFQGQPTDLITLSGSTRVDLRFGQDAKGELYILTKSDGKIYQLTAGAGAEVQ
jgi:glucose/arabinose dehydrogenase/cytochrome c2